MTQIHLTQWFICCSKIFFNIAHQSTVFSHYHAGQSLWNIKHHNVLKQWWWSGRVFEWSFEVSRYSPYPRLSFLSLIYVWIYFDCWEFYLKFIFVFDSKELQVTYSIDDSSFSWQRVNILAFMFPHLELLSRRISVLSKFNNPTYEDWYYITKWKNVKSWHSLKNRLISICSNKNLSLCSFFSEYNPFNTCMKWAKMMGSTSYGCFELNT